MSKRKKVVIAFVVPVVAVVAYVAFIFGIENFSPKPTGRMFPDVACKVNDDCKAVDCTNINQGVWYCDQNGVPVCNAERTCACSYSCL